MNSDALMAALGMDAVAAIRGYRSDIVADAARRGLRLVSGPLSHVTRTARGDAPVMDPLDIRLTFDRSRADLDGRVLRWNAAEGWSARSPREPSAVRYYAGPGARPADLVPAAPAVLDWAVLDRAVAGSDATRYSASPPEGVDIDDDPRTLRRLIDFIEPRHRHHAETTTGGRHSALTR